MDFTIASVLPSLVQKGIFGPGEFQSVSRDEDCNKGFQFSSAISILKLHLRLESGETKTLPIVVKIQMTDQSSWKLRDTASMFNNEVNMYTSVLPYLNKCNSYTYPKFYFGLATNGEDYGKDILILENMEYKGFRLGPKHVFLDYDHIAVGIKKIAEFHAWSFTAKQTDKNGFDVMKDKLRECVGEKDEEFDFESANLSAMRRGMEVFIKEGRESEALEKFLEAVEPVSEAWRLFRSAEEPFGVVIHGDFCANNMFFRYGEGGRPEDGALFDLQHSNYGSPAADLAFFLYLHTSAEMRAAHWDDLLRLYWTEVRGRVPPDLPLPGLGEFLDHFGAKAAFGYLPCSFFLPHMMADKKWDPEDFANMTTEEKKELVTQLGTEGEEQGVRNIVSHLLERKYIHQFLDYYARKKSCN